VRGFRVGSPARVWTPGPFSRLSLTLVEVIAAVSISRSRGALNIIIDRGHTFRENFGAGG
jgi:hypothetical protein